MPLPIPGFATAEATRAYAAAHPSGEGHFSEFVKTRIRLSSIGIGTFPGPAAPEVDAAQSALVMAGLLSGLNVVDTAAHYRYGRALAAVGAGVRGAFLQGLPREAMFLVSKGGFLTFRGGRPEDLAAWFEEEIASRGLGNREDLSGFHLLSPAYLHHQLDLSLGLMGVETLDAFLIDQPEVHIPRLGKEAFLGRLQEIFAMLEGAVAQGKVRFYGLSSFYAFRVATDDPRFLSLASLIALAEKAAGHPRHHFRIIQLPFNPLMPEGFTRFNQATGLGNVASTLQAAYQLRLYAMACHTLHKGHLARVPLPPLAERLPGLSPAQQAIQFARSTPGVGTALVGMYHARHLEEALEVARMAVMDKKMYLSLYQRGEG